MILNLLGMVLFLASCFVMGFVLNYGMHLIAIWRGWYTEPLKPGRTVEFLQGIIDKLEGKQND